MLAFEDYSHTFAFAQQLWDACQQQLVAEEHSTKKLTNAVVMESFIAPLLAETTH